MKYIPPVNGDVGDPDRSYVNADPGTGTEGSWPDARAIEHPMREIIEVITQAALVPDEGDLTQLHQAIVAIVAASVPPAPEDNFSAALLHIQDQKANGTSGGNAVSGSNIRDLNTVLVNQIAGASLLANQITLPVGDYFAMASAPAYQTGDGQVVGHQTVLYDTTAATNLLLGTTEHINGSSADALQTRSLLTGRFTLAEISVLELRHFFSSAETTGLGIAASLGLSEVYSDILLWKVG